MAGIDLVVLIPLITALVVAISNLVVGIKTKNQTQVNGLKSDAQIHQTNQIHGLVNSRMTDALARIAYLEKALKIEPGASVSSPPPATPTGE